jgi:dethiobiotin synthase
MRNRNDLFITGTDTNVGKTVLAATLCAALGRKYWKPVQTGTLEGTDRESVRQYAELRDEQTFPESYRFEPPVSPHLAARMAGTHIGLDAIERPAIDEPLVIEGAGGVLVPLNEKDLMLDLMRRLGAGVVVAARTALGTINHTLLSLHTLRAAGLRVNGVVMIGVENHENRQAIEHFGNVRVIGWIPVLTAIDRRTLLDVFDRHFNRSAFEPLPPGEVGAKRRVRVSLQTQA